MRQIVLSVKRGKFRQEDGQAESADAEFAEIRPRVLARDRRTCLFCDFQADKWQDVHHVNHDHRDNRTDNLITVCKMCHACHHIGLAGASHGGALIHLPELSQTALNRLVRALFVVGKIGSDPWQARASQIWKFLMSRRDPVIAALGSDSPVDLANALRSAPDADYERRENTLGAIRLLLRPQSKMLTLPNRTSVIDYWVKDVYAKIPEDSWLELSEQFFAPSAALAA